MLFTFSIDQDEATAGNFIEPLSPTRFVVPDGPSAGCGKIKLVSQCKTHGKTPRNFACNPDGTEVWVANQVDGFYFYSLVDGVGRVLILFT